MGMGEIKIQSNNQPVVTDTLPKIPSRSTAAVKQLLLVQQAMVA